MIQNLTAVLVVVAWVGALVFVVRYLATTWFSSPMGWHAMAFMVVALALLSLGVSRELFGADWAGRAWVRLVAYVLVTSVIWWRVVFLFTVQARVRRRARQAGPGAMMAPTETPED